MRTAVLVVRGPCRGRTGWISGDLEDRAARGITRAIVKFGPGDVELLRTADLAVSTQLDLPIPPRPPVRRPPRPRRRFVGLNPW
jgi:hypothetical protein